jgi:hypothetical protein
LTVSKFVASEVVADLHRVRLELGRNPSRPEYLKHGKFTTQVIMELFGSYHFLTKAAGLDVLKGKPDKQEIRKQHFEAVKREAEEKRIPVPPSLVHRLLIIPDLHAPYHHPDAIDFLDALHRKYAFDRIVNCGDEIDAHAISFHTHDPDLLSPGHELDAAIKALEPLYKLFPEMDLAESNHGALVYRRGKHFGLPRHVLKPYGEVLCAPAGWRWQHEINLQMSNGKRLAVHHSYGSNVLKESQKRGVCMAFGHHHSNFSIQYWQNYEGLFWAAFASSLADGNALAAEYGKNFSSRPINGAIVVLGGIPQLVPLLQDKYGRWNGVIP